VFFKLASQSIIFLITITIFPLFSSFFFFFSFSYFFSFVTKKVAFFDGVLLPLFTSFCTLLPDCAEVEGQARRNRDAWVESRPPPPFWGFDIAGWLSAFALAAAIFVAAMYMK